MGEDFLKEYGEVAKQVKADPASVDLRAFIRDMSWTGCLWFSDVFNQIGRAFAGLLLWRGLTAPTFPPMTLMTTPCDYLRPGAVSLR